MSAFYAEPVPLTADDVCEQDRKDGSACGKPLFWVDTEYRGYIKSGTCSDCDEERAGRIEW